MHIEFKNTNSITGARKCQFTVIKEHRYFLLTDQAETTSAVIVSRKQAVSTPVSKDTPYPADL